MEVNLDGEETSHDKVREALKEKGWMESLLKKDKVETKKQRGSHHDS